MNWQVEDRFTAIVVVSFSAIIFARSAGQASAHSVAHGWHLSTSGSYRIPDSRLTARANLKEGLSDDHIDLIF
jgi:hypothetical protein